jgi:phosphoglycolate phosphatase
MVKLILFDFDGTIADSLNAGVNLVNENALRFGVKKITDVEAAKNMSFKELCKVHGVNPLKVPFYLMLIKKKLNDNIESIPIFKGMEEIIKILSQKYILGILSSNSKKNILKFLKAYNLDGYFKFVISSPNIFLKSLAIRRISKKEKVPFNEIIYIGDEVRDIKATKKVNVPIISVSWGYNSFEILDKNNPNFLIKYPKEILKILD